VTEQADWDYFIERALDAHTYFPADEVVREFSPQVSSFILGYLAAVGFTPNEIKEYTNAE
jgi:hypothetical protein